MGLCHAGANGDAVEGEKDTRDSRDGGVACVLLVLFSGCARERLPSAVRHLCGLFQARSSFCHEVVAVPFGAMHVHCNELRYCLWIWYHSQVFTHSARSHLTLHNVNS